VALACSAAGLPRPVLKISLLRHVSLRTLQHFRIPRLCRQLDAVITRAEEDARYALQNLPDNIVTSFRGLATDIKMDQQPQRIASDARWQAIESQMNEMSSTLGMIGGAKGSKKRKVKNGE
jgi:hypothetical protein